MYTLLLNKDADSQSMAFESMEAAFDAATPFAMDGYICRIADDQGVVQFTQALQGGRIQLYKGDATTAAVDGAAAPQPRRRPWWKFWERDSSESPDSPEPDFQRDTDNEYAEGLLEAAATAAHEGELDQAEEMYAFVAKCWPAHRQYARQCLSELAAKREIQRQ